MTRILLVFALLVLLMTTVVLSSGSANNEPWPNTSASDSSAAEAIVPDRPQVDALLTALPALSPPGFAPGQIHVTKARIGCLDIQQSGNLTEIVKKACDGKQNCSYKAPTPDQYKKAGVQAATRPFCSQGMEITYDCGDNDFHTAKVNGDAWDNPPAQLVCKAPTPAKVNPVGFITVSAARIGCLDIQKNPNMTSMVAAACDNKKLCTYKAPTEAQYKAAGVEAATRTFCSQAMEVTYQCGSNDFRTINLPGDAWNQPPVVLDCRTPEPAKNVTFEPGEGPITVTAARIGCLDIQKSGNLTAIVAKACNNKGNCTYKAPTPDEYKAAGVQAATRTFCSQAMEITYHCGKNGDQIETVDGDAWNHPPARLICDGSTIATNNQDVSPPPQGTSVEPICDAPTVWTPDPATATQYILAPANMLDWMPHISQGDYTMQGFRPATPPTRDMYRSKPGTIQGAPGSTLGANEGRVRDELRAVAKKKDPINALCQSAKMFTRNKPARDADTPSDAEFGNAFADLSVTGKATFAEFVRLHPTAETLKANAACSGATDAALGMALDRAYTVARVLRLPHDSAERKKLHWIAVSGEDDQPYRPVNVPSTDFPQFQIEVKVPKWGITVNTRYMIAHRKAPTFPTARAALVDGGPGRRVPADPLPAIASDAEVLLFIHGMDSRLEEAIDLSKAMHSLPDGKNWTIISLDLPTSGYADNIDPGAISPAAEVACHNTPVVDFIEDFIVAFVNAVDDKVQGQLKPKIQAVVGGSLGGNMSMRLGRRPNTPWVRHVVPWSPAAIWPSMIAQKECVACGCDTGWDETKDRAVNLALRWSGRSNGGERFLPENETPELRRELFYGGFDWDSGLLVEIFSGKGHMPQAGCWFSNNWRCKDAEILAARIDRQETYNANYRAWHWRLGAEQLAFSQQQFVPGTKDPLYLRNTKPMLLFAGYEDVCGDLGEHTRKVAAKMVNTPGYARFLRNTGHSLDNEHPVWVAQEIATFLSRKW